MYNLKDFIEYEGEKLSANDNVLVWSKAGGYEFTQYSKAGDRKIVAFED
jgi:hypothetical protein